jgi:hypothetical protein
MRPRWLAGLGLLMALARPDTVAAQVRVAGYDVFVDVRADGSANADFSISIESGGAASILIPVPSGTTSCNPVDPPAGIAFTMSEADGQASFAIDIPEGVLSPFEFRTRCNLDRAMSGAASTPRLVRVRLLNTERSPLHDVAIRVRFPRAYRGHAIRETLPKGKPSEAGARATFEEVGGTPGVVLRLSRLTRGEAAALSAELAATERSGLWIVLGLGLAACYLWSFRDLVVGRSERNNHHVDESRK